MQRIKRPKRNIHPVMVIRVLAPYRTLDAQHGAIVVPAHDAIHLANGGTIQYITAANAARINSAAVKKPKSVRESPPLVS